MKSNEELFKEVFGNEITNVEFYGTVDSGYNCIIYMENGDQYSSNSHNTFYNIYDAFAYAYQILNIKR
jgi:hypothetical protein